MHKEKAFVRIQHSFIKNKTKQKHQTLDKPGKRKSLKSDTEHHKAYSKHYS